MNKLYNKIKSNWFLLIIILISAFFRFYKIGKWFTFNFDEEYQVLLAWEQVKNFHPIWIGVSAFNVGFYLGPGVTYLCAILLQISKDPLILAYFASLLGVITTLNIYYVTSKLHFQKAGIYATLIYSASTFAAYFDRRFWSATPIVFISIWFYFSLVKAQKNIRWLVLTAILMALSLHVHLSLLSFWPIALFIVWTIHKNIKLKNWLLIIGSYLLFISPLIVFDYFHNFDNLKMPLRFVQKFLSSNQGGGNVFGNLPAFYKVLSNFWFLRFNTNIEEDFGLGIHGNSSPAYLMLILFSLVIIFWLVYQAVVQKKYRILLMSMLLFIFAFLTYSAGTVQYFLLGFLVLFAINAGLFFSAIPQKLSYVIIGGYIIANCLVLLTTTQTQYGLMIRKQLIKKIYPYIKNESFYLTTLSPDKRQYHSSGGWRYLFKAYGKTPDASYADKYFGWIYSDEIKSNQPKLNVIISEYKPDKLPGKPIVSFQSGVYYGYVIKN